MAAVYVNNLIINTGSDFTQVFTLENSSGSLFDLTGYTADSQMRKWSGSSSAVDFTASILIPSTSGQIMLSLTSQQTSNIKPGRYIYDVLIIDEFNIKNKVIEGMVLVAEGVTR